MPDEDEISQSDTRDPNRGKLPPKSGSGEAVGSGAGAGGGGGAEDFDDDPVSGGGSIRIPAHPGNETGADAPSHNSR